MKVIFRSPRGYLSERYDWKPVPDLFPSWHVHVVLCVMRGVMEMAEVEAGGVIDLDNLEWIRIHGATG